MVSAVDVSLSATWMNTPSIAHAALLRLSSAAFERRLKAHKFNVFAISRLGTGRKKPLDPPKDAGPGAANDADDIMNCKRGAVLRLLYQIKMVIDKIALTQKPGVG